MTKTSVSTHRIFIVFACLWWVLPSWHLSAQDTTGHDRRQHLDPVVVTKERKPSATLSQAPVQVVDIEKIERTGAMVLSDAVRQMAGVTLRDYGGVGGMKTMSARGLGSQFSTLTIDGVAVNDCQNGQVDLGRYMVGNSAFISLSNGQQEELMLSARASAAGNILNMTTQEPLFLPGERTHLRFGMEGGSFGLLSPSLAIDRSLGEKLSLSFWGNYLRSNGDYPFTLYYTNDHNGAQSRERREHSAMWLATGDLNVFYTIAHNRQLTAKVHYVQGYHELPGPVVFYASRGSENTHEQLFFTQVRYREEHQKLSFQLLGKYQYTNDLYEDFKAPTASRYLKNEYSQQEGYLSGTLLWRPLQGLTASLASDAALTTLQSNLARNSHVERVTLLESATLQYRHARFDIKGNLLATLINEDACDNASVIHYRKVSPYIGLSVKPLRRHNVRLRYFFKETYRVPNFNEMYYFVMPLDTLHPECATQHNIGVTLPLTVRYSKDSLSQRYYSLTVDGYRNGVRDKIIAVPRQNMFLWSTMNLGKVEITGLDIKGAMDWERGKLAVNATLTYSYQRAIDRSDPDNEKTYGHQIPYTPRHSGGVTLYFKNPWVNLGYNCMVVGERYYQQQNSDNSRMPAYADHGITLDRLFELPLCDLRLQAQVLNLLDVQYEVVRSYPMMGRNFRMKLEIRF